MLCWGVYRFRDSQHGSNKIQAPSSKRYVICNPSSEFILMPTDLVYVLQQFKPRQSIGMSETSNFNLLTRGNSERRSSSQRSKNSKRTVNDSNHSNLNIQPENEQKKTKTKLVSDSLKNLNEKYQENFGKTIENIQMINKSKSMKF